MSQYYFSFISFFIGLILIACSGEYYSEIVQEKSDDNVYYSESLGLYLPIPEGYELLSKEKFIEEKNALYNRLDGDQRTMDMIQQVVQNPKGVAFKKGDFLSSNLLIQGLSPMEMNQERLNKFAKMFETYPDKVDGIDRIVIHEKRLVKGKNYEGLYFKNEMIFSDGTRTDKNVTVWVDFGKGMSYVFNFNNKDIDPEEYLSEVR
ncbi:MAG: hypothetical protein ACJA2C_002856 [Marinoscillum sp.]|jgi:hypothetical protein